jgi:SdrD B-like domain
MSKMNRIKESDHMSQDVRQTELQQQTQQLLQGPLKRIAGAGLAAALVPLAAVAVSTQQQRFCQSGGTICGYVWQDANNNGIRDAGELPIVGAVVQLDSGTPIATDASGYYQFDPQAGTYLVKVQIPPGTQPSPHDQGSDDTVDSDGIADGVGNSVATVTLTAEAPINASTDFGFSTPPSTPPGTGTPGYWKNHPEAWPVETITVGGVSYTKAEAISWLERVGKDRTITMFSSLVPAKLNVLIGNDGSCVASTIAAADEWMATYGPVGSNVHAASLAWKLGEPLHRQMDNYNNGMLCAPHRD